MCEFCKVFEDSMAKYQQWMRGINVPNDNYFKNVLNYVRQGVCPSCGINLSYEDMHPINAACTRSLCEPCYQQIFTSHINSNCPVCEHELPKHKVQAQKIGRKGIREVRNHLHEGCLSRWALMHAHVVGYPPEAEKVVHHLRSLYSPGLNHHHVLPGYSSNKNVIKIQGSLPGGRKALNPATRHPFTFDQLFQKKREEDKEVFYIELPRD